MSILKAILHHYNSQNKNYDTLHPETETAQITDWHSGIMASLASKTLGTVVDAITTDSVLGKLIKMLLNASGVKYSINTNGYICFGEFFGGLIIQWGLCDLTQQYNDVDFPISFPNKVNIVYFTDVIASEVTAKTSVFAIAWLVKETTKSKARAMTESSGVAGRIAMIAIGK